MASCAVISVNGASVEFLGSKFRRILDINVTGTFLATQATAREMIKANVSGSIVLVASDELPTKFISETRRGCVKLRVVVRRQPGYLKRSNGYRHYVFDLISISLQENIEAHTMATTISGPLKGKLAIVIGASRGISYFTPPRSDHHVQHIRGSNRP
ncbi:hypothetical protein BDV12DRAFT_203913 [Aspergillus spectabilis]